MERDFFRPFRYYLWGGMIINKNVVIDKENSLESLKIKLPQLIFKQKIQIRKRNFFNVSINRIFFKNEKVCYPILSYIIQLDTHNQVYEVSTLQWRLNYWMRTSIVFK